MQIFRDAEGVCINIGPWDYDIDPYTGVVRNPLPEDAFEDDAAIVTDAEGGRRVVDPTPAPE